MQRKKVYLIDGMSVVFRAYYAMSRSGLKSSKTGEPTYAVYAFVNILTSLLEKENPEYIAVVFDSREPSFRHKMFKEYKANRLAFPEDLAPQLERIKEFLDAMRIKRLEIPGYEADDIIGSLAKKFEKQGLTVICLTNDKDFYQLVGENILIYKSGKDVVENFEIIDNSKVQEKFGVPPEKVVDVLAIVGDSVDNVPGVKGIGEKSAIPLIQRYGSLENLFENISLIEKEALRKKLIENREMAFLSKKLVTIETNIPLDLHLEQLKKDEPDKAKLLKFFETLDFKSFLGKEISTEQTNGNNYTLPTEECVGLSKFEQMQKRYVLVNSKELLDELISRLKSSKGFAIDTETSSLNKLTCELVGLSFSFSEHEAYYVPVYEDFQSSKESSFSVNEKEHNFDLFSTELTEEKVKEIKLFEDSYNPKKGFSVRFLLTILKNYLENEQIEKYGQNIKFDSYILRRYGVEIKPIVFDTMVASYLLNPDEQHNLDALSRKWLSYDPISISSLIGERKSKQISMRELSPEQVKDYACEDADLVYQLTNILRQELKKEGLTNLAENIEFPLIEVLCQIEWNGVFVSSEILRSISYTLKEQVRQVEEAIFREAGQKFNLDSPKQLGHILFEKLKLPIIAKTKTGYSTDVSTLTQLAGSYPIAKLILEYRQMTKLLSTYVDALPELINPQTGRIHTTFNQTIAATGRLSSTEPNLQNIPIRSEFGKEIRKAFVPQRPDWVILSADYSQIELRIAAYISGDKNLVEAFKNGLDIHSATASLLFNKPIDQVDNDMRRVAKTVNFGILYGLGPFGLSQRLGISRTEAHKIIEDYLIKYSGIKKYMDDTIKLAQKKGYAETLLGRRRFFPNLNSQNKNIRAADERAAINFPIQGTASDMMKIAMINIHNELKRRNLRTMMILQIHDELLFEVPLNELENVKELVKDNMEKAKPLGDVPVVVDIGVGTSWYDAH
ncbi:MAG: DNA polymerase I [Ignavibacteria bacterium]|nr:DNA polymerase I [Ignavibacteria bacterium]